MPGQEDQASVYGSRTPGRSLRWLVVSETFKNRDVFAEPPWTDSRRVSEATNHLGPAPILQSPRKNSSR